MHQPSSHETATGQTATLFDTNRPDLNAWAEERFTARAPDLHGRHVPFAELIERATRADLDGLIVCVASLDDVIASKEWADRPKDRAALPELRGLRGLRDQPG